MSRKKIISSNRPLLKRREWVEATQDFQDLKKNILLILFIGGGSAIALILLGIKVRGFAAAKLIGGLVFAVTGVGISELLRLRCRKCKVPMKRRAADFDPEELKKSFPYRKKNKDGTCMGMFYLCKPCQRYIPLDKVSWILKQLRSR